MLRHAAVSVLLAALASCAGPREVAPGAEVVACGPPAGELVYWTSALDPGEVELLGELAPRVRFVTDLDPEAALLRAGEFHGADAHLLSEEFLSAATELRWVQAWSAGVDRYLGLRGLMEREDLAFTNMKGAHGPVIAEHVFGMLLAQRRELYAFRDAQREARWDRRAGTGQAALAGSTLLVVGMGGIGAEVARRGHAFGMEVLATVRTPRETPEFVAELGLAADLDRLLPRADVVVISLPLTDETRGLFDAARLARMRPGATLVNIARGPIVDTEALVAALESGHLGGACLDVTDPEPLPTSSPLWGREDVILTPHVAGVAELTGERRSAIFRENVRRFAAGEPLLNLVDRAAGY
jgi:phosphoglycerate dehydrogenase-like enzyme